MTMRPSNSSSVGTKGLGTGSKGFVVAAWLSAGAMSIVASRRGRPCLTETVSVLDRLDAGDLDAGNLDTGDLVATILESLSIVI